MALLGEAVRVGLRLWAPELAEGVATIAWSSDRDAVPFMEAVLAYGIALMEEGYWDEAAQCLRFLLRIDPDDRFNAVAAMEEVGLVSPGIVLNDEGPSHHRGM